MLDGNFDREEYKLAQNSEYYTHIDYKTLNNLPNYAILPPPLPHPIFPTRRGGRYKKTV